MFEIQNVLTDAILNLNIEMPEKKQTKNKKNKTVKAQNLVLPSKQ